MRTRNMTSISKGNRQNEACTSMCHFWAFAGERPQKGLYKVQELFGSRASSLCYGERWRLKSNEMSLVLNCLVILLLDSGASNFRKSGGNLLLWLWLCVEHEEGSARRAAAAGGALCGSLRSCFCWLFGDWRHLTLVLSALVSRLERWRLQ